LREVRSRADNVHDFEHSTKSKVQSPGSNVRLRILTLNLGHWALDLKANNSRTATPSYITVQRIARINHQRGQLGYAAVINFTVVGNNNYAIRVTQLGIIQLYRGKRF